MTMPSCPLNGAVRSVLPAHGPLASGVLSDRLTGRTPPAVQEGGQL